MKIWNGASTINFDKSISEDLLFAILAKTPKKELSPYEKLFIALKSGIPYNERNLTDVYLACGCFAKAKEAYIKIGHTRKIGDMCWIQGDFEEAKKHYLNPISKAQHYRTQPDYDRLIKLAFMREQWNDVIRFFIDAQFRFGVTKGYIVCGSSEISARPFLEMLAVALFQMNVEPSPEILSVLQSSFFLSKNKFYELQHDLKSQSTKTIQKLKKRCPPAPGKKTQITVEAAISLGDTQRSNNILNYLKECNELLCEAQECLEQFAHTGNESDLNRFIEIITYSGITSVSQSFLFSATGHNSFTSSYDILPERLVKLYSSHPVMYKKYYGELLRVKFDNHLPLCGTEIITGLFQQASSINAIVNPESVQKHFKFGQLVNFRDWAELCVEDWISGSGHQHIENVSHIWRKGLAQDVNHPFGIGDKKKPATPRNMIEWNELLNAAAKWLQKQWRQEIGTTTWVSENQLFQLLKRQLKGMNIQQHAQPTWLSPQHLDVYIPEVSIAIEYMGIQHYKPIDFFGGEAGFIMIQDRDKRKAQKCREHNVKLYFVKYNNDMGERVKKIIGDIKTA